MSLTTPTVRLPDRWSFFKMIATRFPGRMSLRFWPSIYVPFTLFCRLRAGIGVLAREVLEDLYVSLVGGFPNLRPGAINKFADNEHGI